MGDLQVSSWIVGQHTPLLFQCMMDMYFNKVKTFMDNSSIIAVSKSGWIVFYFYSFIIILKCVSVPLNMN